MNKSKISNKNYCIIYSTFVICHILYLFPKLLLPIDAVLGKTIFDLLYDTVRFGEHMIIPFFVFSSIFIFFICLLAYKIYRSGIRKELFIVISNFILPVLLFENMKSNYKYSSAILIMVVSIAIFTLRTTTKTCNRLSVTED